MFHQNVLSGLVWVASGLTLGNLWLSGPTPIFREFSEIYATLDF